jgi:uncharacterized protein
MTSKALIDDFIAQKSLAIVGVSRAGNKFGNGIYRELKTKGYSLFIIHPEAELLEGATVYKDFSSLPERVSGVLICVKPGQSESVVRLAAASGISRVWLQQGSESRAAIDFCNQNGINVIHNECILMYAVGTGLHGFHRWLWKLFGRAPK